MGLGLEEWAEGVPRREESRVRESPGERKAGCSTKIYLVLVGWRQRVRRGCHRQSATKLGMRTGGWIRRRGGKVRSEALLSALMACLPLCQA